MKKLLLLLPVLFLTCIEKNYTEEEKWEKQATGIEIIRDNFGVAHVYGKTDADAVFGVMYAQCEDDFPRVEYNYIRAIGRLAEVEGEKKIWSDLRVKMFMTKSEAIKKYETVPNWLKKLCRAWADGINYYLYKNPDVKPILLKRFEPWMTMYFTEGSIGGDIEQVNTHLIQDFYEGDSESNPNLTLNESVFEEPSGSNGFAISGGLTASGHAMLLINPHTTFYFRGEYHMVSDEGLNVYGAITWGQFFVYQGFNENTGWMHTSTYTDAIDEFVETIKDSEESKKYKYGEEWRNVEEQSVTIKYRDNDKMSFRSFPVYRTCHGPITHRNDTAWIATSLMWKPAKALEQSYVRTKKKNYAEFREMMNMRTNSSNNTVFADSEGNIAYFHGNFIPKRNTKFDYTQPVDGSNPETQWKELHDVEDCIKLLNPPNGWIQNCNSTPFTAAAEFSPKKEDYPSYMSRIPENFRGVNAIRLLSKVNALTLDGLVELAYDPYLPAFEKVIPGLIKAYDNNAGNYPNLEEPVEVLRNWDLTTSEQSVAKSLAHFYGMQLYQNVEIPDSLVGLDRFNWFGTGLEDEKRIHQFVNAVEKITHDFGRWDTPWGEICRFQRVSGSIDAGFDDEIESIPIGLTTAKWGTLAAYGMRGKYDVKKIYGTRGNSFIAVVEFGEKIKAKTLLVGGQTNNPQSLHFDDQAQMYADGVFKTVAFYRKDVEARAKKSYKPGES